MAFIKKYLLWFVVFGALVGGYFFLKKRGAAANVGTSGATLATLNDILDGGAEPNQVPVKLIQEITNMPPPMEAIYDHQLNPAGIPDGTAGIKQMKDVLPILWDNEDIVLTTDDKGDYYYPSV